ncbi:MAG: hypothetical protein ACI3YG_09725 [Prevotella sp.]
MMINLNEEALKAVNELCSEDSLEVSVSLMEESIDMLLSEQLPEKSEETIDLVRAYRRLSKLFNKIRENIKEDRI